MVNRVVAEENEAIGRRYLMEFIKMSPVNNSEGWLQRERKTFNVSIIILLYGGLHFTDHCSAELDRVHAVSPAGK